MHNILGAGFSLHCEVRMLSSSHVTVNFAWAFVASSFAVRLVAQIDAVPAGEGVDYPALRGVRHHSQTGWCTGWECIPVGMKHMCFTAMDAVALIFDVTCRCRDLSIRAVTSWDGFGSQGQKALDNQEEVQLFLRQPSVGI